MKDHLPVIDFSSFRTAPLERQRAIGQEIDQACRTFGFFYLANHGIAQHHINACFSAALTFFEQPEAEKQKISIAHSPCHRGWYRMHEEMLNPEVAPLGDQKEGLKIGRECGPTHPRVQAGMALHGSNQWPSIEGWRETMEATYVACEQLGRDLMQAIALGLGLEGHFFDRWLREPMATLSPIYYPPTASSQMGAGAHTDFGCLTILFQNNIGGLEVLARDQHWQSVPPHEGYAVINLGDMLARWTNGEYSSTVHRVINRSGEPRQSLAFFFDPDPEADLAPLPGCDRKAPRFARTTALNHLLEKIDASFSYRQAGSSEVDTGL